MRNVSRKACLVSFFSGAFLAFGMYHVHSVAGISEGGVLGAMLLIQHWLHISPALSCLAVNSLCYFLGWRTLGGTFLVYSGASVLGYSAGYAVWEQFPPLYPAIADMPLIAAVAGSLFVGIGCGLSVRMGGAPGGDDALAMSISAKTGIAIQWVYLVSDLLVLGLSLSYIPVKRIGYSLLTVVLSGQIIGWLQKGK